MVGVIREGINTSVPESATNITQNIIRNEVDLNLKEIVTVSESGITLFGDKDFQRKYPNYNLKKHQYVTNEHGYFIPVRIIFKSKISAGNSFYSHGWAIFHYTDYLNSEINNKEFNLVNFILLLTLSIIMAVFGIILNKWLFKPLTNENDSLRVEIIKLEHMVSIKDIEIANYTAIAKTHYDSKDSLSKYIINVCHEIQTPINVIVSEVQSYKFKSPLVHKANTQLNYLIDDLSSVNQILNGVFHFTKADFNVLNCVNSVIEISSAVYNNKKRKCTIILNQSLDIPKTIHSDEKRISQVLMNLLNNALKYSRSSVVGISINKTKVEDTDYLEFSVFDYGVGIDSASYTSVNEVFTSKDECQFFKKSSHGLGLTIAKTFIQKLGGYISLHNNNPSGLRVSLKFPIAFSGSIRKSVIVDRERRGHPIAVITSLPELAFKISENLSTCVTIDYTSIRKLLQNTRKLEDIKYIYLCSDVFDEFEDISLINEFQGRGIEVYGDQSKENNFIDGISPLNISELEVLKEKASVPSAVPSQRILVVEDNEDCLSQYRNACEDLDYSMRICKNKQQALFVLNAEKFDIVLTDIRLDEESIGGDKGFDLALHANNTINRGVPFIAVTGSSVLEMQEFYARNNINGLIIKGKSITEIDKNLILTLLNEPRKLCMNKGSFKGELTPKIVELLKTLLLSESPDTICANIEKMSCLLDNDHFLDCSVVQSKRYKKNNIDTYLLKRCVSNIDKYLNN